MGMERGMEHGMERGKEAMIISLLPLHDDQTLAEIANYPLEKVQELRAKQ